MRHILLPLLLLAAAPLLAQKRYALVVGNGNYAYASLGATPVSDALAMRDALRQAGFEVDYFSNLDLAMLAKATADFGRKIKNSGAVALFYYSGHGVQHQNQNWLVPIGAELADEDDIDGLCVPIERITSRMVGTTLNLIILDACRTYPLSRGSKALTKGLTKETAPVAELLVAYATTPGSTATVSGEGGLSLYTGCLLKHLKTPGLPLSSVFQKTRTDVAAKSSRQQIPQESGGLTQEFFFFPERRSDPTPPVTEQPIQTEKTPANPATNPQSGATSPPNGAGAGGGVDTDEDGTPDAQDDCPKDYGPRALNGCPDHDFDETPDIKDACPDQPGPKNTAGCPDRDRDGVADKDDQCPDTPGLKTFAGCPDGDGDAVIDSKDDCPDTPGLKRFNGCPDKDFDETPDHKDGCPDTRGPKTANGCPDRDGDGVADKDDLCPDVPGTAAGKGCADPAPEGFVLVPGGTFQMGSETGSSDEKPVHTVTVNDFYLSKYEVTVADFKKFIDGTAYKTDADKEGWSYSWIGSTWDKKKGVNWRCDAEGKVYVQSDHNNPVIHVSWNDAVAYCKWLSKKTGKTYRLPTEAEWEYAAAGGDPQKTTRTTWAGTSTESDLRSYANYSGTGSTDTYTYTAPVGSFQPNPLGLYDMSGNVWEWCSDWYAAYPSSAQTNPTGPTEGAYRVLRGGCWLHDAGHCRAAYRITCGPTVRLTYIGFRVAASFQ